MDPTQFIAQAQVTACKAHTHEARTVDAFYAQHGLSLFARLARWRRSLRPAPKLTHEVPRFAPPAQI